MGSHDYRIWTVKFTVITDSVCSITLRKYNKTLLTGHVLSTYITDVCTWWCQLLAWFTTTKYYHNHHTTTTTTTAWNPELGSKLVQFFFPRFSGLMPMFSILLSVISVHLSLGFCAIRPPVISHFKLFVGVLHTSTLQMCSAPFQPSESNACYYITSSYKPQIS